METNAKWYTNGKSKNVKVLVCKDYETLSKKAAAIIAGIVNVKPDAILGLATGSSPVGTYKELIRMYNEGTLDFSQVRTYNLDEYYPLEPTNDQSYHYFMDDNLFNHVNIDKNNVHVPDGNAEDMNEACTSYEAMLDEIGGVDMQHQSFIEDGAEAYHAAGTVENFQRQQMAVAGAESVDHAAFAQRVGNMAGGSFQRLLLGFECGGEKIAQVFKIGIDRAHDG